MNERILQLASAAGFDIEEGGHIMLHHVYLTNRMEQFAQLITKECCNAADDWYKNHNNIHWDPAQHIRNHLGLEE